MTIVADFSLVSAIKREEKKEFNRLQRLLQNQPQKSSTTKKSSNSTETL
jgi:hypothetical protein